MFGRYARDADTHINRYSSTRFRRSSVLTMLPLCVTDFRASESRIIAYSLRDPSQFRIKAQRKTKVTRRTVEA